MYSEQKQTKKSPLSTQNNPPGSESHSKPEAEGDGENNVPNLTPTPTPTNDEEKPKEEAQEMINITASPPTSPQKKRLAPASQDVSTTPNDRQ